MRRALLEADDLDPRAGLKESFVKRIHMAAILYMRGAAVDFPAARQVRVIGMCSDPDPQEWFRTQPQPQPTLVWYQLAELEAETAHDRAVLEELRKRTKSGGLLPMETMLASSLAQAAVRDLDVDRFLEALKTYPRAVVEGIRNMRGWGGGDILNQPVGHLVPIAESEWTNDSIAQSTKSAVLSFMLTCGSRGRRDVMTDFRQKILGIPGLAAEVEGLFQVVDEPSEDETDAYVVVSSIVGRLLKGEAFDVNDVFFSAVYILQLLENSPLAPPAAAAMMSFYEKVWPDIIEKRGFSMRSPATNGPYISEAMCKGDTAMQRMANMTVAMEAAVKRSLSTDLRERFAKIAAKRVELPLPAKEFNPQL